MLACFRACKSLRSLCIYNGGAMYLHFTSVILLAQNPDLNSMAMIMSDAVDFRGSYYLLQSIKSTVKDLRKHRLTPENLIQTYPTTPDAFKAEHPDVFEKAFRSSNAGPMHESPACIYVLSLVAKIYIPFACFGCALPLL